MKTKTAMAPAFAPQRRKVALMRTAYLALVLPFLAVPEARAAERPDQVEVVNTTVNPVPVAPQGVTTVSGTVEVSGTPTVLVGNSEAIAVKATSAAPQIVQSRTVLSIQPGAHFGGSGDTTVPGGKVLVFDHVSAVANCEPGQTAWLSLEVNSPGGTSDGDFQIPPSDLGAFPIESGGETKQHLIFGQAIRAYVTPGGEYSFSAVRSASTGTCLIGVTWAAHYIDAP